MKPPLIVHSGETVHRRFVPFVSGFSYRIFMIDLDIDRLDAASRQCALFSVHGPGLFSFKPSDHGAQGREKMRLWANAEFSAAGLDASELKIRLITFPRHVFYKFAPISLWIAETADAKPRGILYEVRNTFGERHIYAAKLSGNWHRHAAEKAFHVSPFFDISGIYQFSLQYRERELSLGVTTIKDGAPQHLATLTTSSHTASNKTFLRAAILMPLSTLGVSIGIHWEALKLWLKGADYHPKPHKEANTRSIAQPSKPTDWT
jgi:DUF1365 family protein